MTATHSELSIQLDPPARRTGLWTRLGATPTGRLGLVLAVLVLLIAFLGPLVAPNSISTVIGPPYQPPSSAAWLGTDFLGRDVLSRILVTGRTLPVVALGAACIAYAIGGLIGLLLGMRRDAVDVAGVALVDVLLSIPPLIFALLLLAAAGTGVKVTAFALAFVLVPPIVRVVRSATLEAVTMEYVDAAEARGESRFRIAVFEILPNVSGVLVADFGIRVAYATLLYASLSFLGLGPTPPDTDWGLMVAENRTGLIVSPVPVLAPAITIAMLVVGITLVADALIRSSQKAGS